MPHTPGPWRLEIRHHYRNPLRIVVDEHLWDIAFAVCGPSGNGEGCFATRDAEEATANGQLMAAAPDLLASLKTLCEKYKANEMVAAWNPGTERHDVWQAALAAITKAESK